MSRPADALHDRLPPPPTGALLTLLPAGRLEPSVQPLGMGMHPLVPYAVPRPPAQDPPRWPPVGRGGLHRSFVRIGEGGAHGATG